MAANIVNNLKNRRFDKRSAIEHRVKATQSYFFSLILEADGATLIHPTEKGTILDKRSD